MYKKYLFCFILIVVHLQAIQAQPNADEQAVITVIETLFEGMKKGDSTLVKKVFTSETQLYTVIEKNGEVSLNTVPVKKFISAVGTPHDEVWDERISMYEIKIDQRLATAWTPYKFYLGDQYSHCGVNAFQLYKAEDGWKILQITDTRRLTDCP